jgi:hypothetical protein
MGVTVIVALIADVVALVAVKEGTFPDPPAARPIAVFEFVQVNVAPAGELLNDVSGTVAPGQTTELEGTLAIGCGLIVITAAAEVTDPQVLVITTS